MQQQRRQTLHSIQHALQGSTVAKIGAYFVAALVLIALGIEACLLIGMPMPPNMISDFYYWMYLVMFILGILSILIFEIAIFGAASGATIAAIVLFSLAAAWRVVMLIWLAIVLGSCDGDLTCADNLDCLGGVLGPYDGPSDRFLGIFCMNIISLIIYIIAAAVTFFSVYKAIVNVVVSRGLPGYTTEYDIAAAAIVAARKNEALRENLIRELKKPVPEGGAEAEEPLLGAVAGEYSDSSNPLVQEATDDEFSGRHRSGGHRHKSHGV